MSSEHSASPDEEKHEIYRRKVLKSIGVVPAAVYPGLGIEETAPLLGVDRERASVETTSLDDSNSAGTGSVTELWTQQAALVAADGDAYDQFGDSVALSGDGITALTGAPGDEDPHGRRAGSAYVFTNDGNSWRRGAKLTAADGDSEALFGGSVALSTKGSTALVGAPGDDDPNGDGAGSTYVFERTGDSWRQQSKLAAADGDGGGLVGWSDAFGSAVALSADGATAVVGAPGDEDPNGDLAGSAYVFERTDGSWRQVAKLAAADGRPEDAFGHSVAVSDDGSTALVGSFLTDKQIGLNAGAAYLFTNSGGSWRQQSKLDTAAVDYGDFFGWSVALSGDGTTALVGAYNDEDPNGPGAGSAYVFTRSRGAWSQQAKLAAAEGDRTDGFGSAVALSNGGSTAIVGADGDEGPNGDGAGSVYVFERSDDSWEQAAKLAATDGDGEDEFGGAVSVSDGGSTALVGAVGDDDPNGERAGSAYVFGRESDPVETTPGSDPTTNPQRHSKTIENRHLSVIVGDSGAFKLSTSDGEQLTYTNKFTSGLTVHVDGTNYVLGKPPGESINQYQRGSTTFNEDTTAATTRWELPEAVTVKQTISLSGEAVSFTVRLENNGDGERNIKVRYLFDYQTGQQDGTPILVDGELVTTETRVENPDVQTWKTYDQFPNPAVTGEGYFRTPPDRLSFVHWPSAVQSSYEYAGFDPGRPFHQDGYATSPESDSCGLLFWDLGTIGSGETSAVDTFYGVGTPRTASISALETAMTDYRAAVGEYFDAFVTGKARANAALYSGHGAAYATPLVNYFGYRADRGDISAADVDATIRRQLDELTGDIDPETAATLYYFYDEMFGAASPDSDVGQIAATFETFVRGTSPDQSEYFTVDGQRLDSFSSSVTSTIEDNASEFLDQLRSSDRKPPLELIDRTARMYEQQTARVRRRAASLTDDFESLATAVRDGHAAKGQFTSVATNQPAAGLPMATIASPVPDDERFGATTVAIGEGATVVDGGAIAQSNLYSSSTAAESSSRSTLLRWEAMHSLHWQRELAKTGGNLTDLTDKSLVLGWNIGELADDRVTISDLSIGDISEDDIATENGARVAKKRASITLQNSTTHRDVAITPRFVRDQCYITQINASGEPTDHFGTVVVPSSDEIPEIAPGDETTVEFLCLVPLDIEAGSYELTMTLEANQFAIDEARGFTTFGVDIGASSALELQTLSDGTLAEGDTTRTSYEPSNNADTGTIRIDYGGGDLDLHLYDGTGQHVGRNYDTGTVDRDIPGVTYSGPDSGTASTEWMHADNISGLSGLETEVVALETGADGSSLSVTAAEIPLVPADLKIYPNPILLAGELDSTIERDVVVAEIGGDTVLTNPSLVVSDLAHETAEHTIGASATEISDSISIDAGGQTGITLRVEIPEAASAGIYTGSVMIDSGESTYTADVSLAVTEGPAQDASAADDGSNSSNPFDFPSWTAPVAAGGGTALGIAGLIKYLSSDSDDSRRR